MRKMIWTTALGLGLGLAFTAPALAGAPVNGCRTLSQSGSYEVTRNLSSPGRDCLVVAADFVTIDLGGYLINGFGSGNGTGVTDNGIARRGVEVRNGTITGFNTGIDLRDCTGCIVKKVRAIANTNDGIKIGESAVLKHNVATDNGDDGLRADAGSLIKDNTARNNGSEGITADARSTTVNNTSIENGGDGIFVDCPSNVIGNTADNNGGIDINLDGGGCNDVDNQG